MTATSGSLSDSSSCLTTAFVKTDLPWPGGPVIQRASGLSLSRHLVSRGSVDSQSNVWSVGVSIFDSRIALYGGWLRFSWHFCWAFVSPYIQSKKCAYKRMIKVVLTANLAEWNVPSRSSELFLPIVEFFSSRLGSRRLNDHRISPSVSDCLNGLPVVECVTLTTTCRRILGNHKDEIVGTF